MQRRIDSIRGTTLFLRRRLAGCFPGHLLRSYLTGHGHEADALPV